MQAATALIDFLMSLMRDDDVRASFEQNPQATLARYNLDGVTGQDVRDASLVMADSGAVRARAPEWSSSGHEDAVREIHHTTRNFEVPEQRFNFVTINDNDTLINDSFNDSFNSDDDGVDTDTTNVVAIQDNDTTNDIDVVEDSFNELNELTEFTEAPGPQAPAPAGEEPVTILPVEEPDGPFTEEPAIPVPVDTEPTEEEPETDEPDLDPVAG